MSDEDAGHNVKEIDVDDDNNDDDDRPPIKRLGITPPGDGAGAGGLMGALLANVTKDNVRRLKPTPTVVRGQNGTVKIERGELITSEKERKGLMDASVLAGKVREDAEEEKRRKREEAKALKKKKMIPKWKPGDDPYVVTMMTSSSSEISVGETPSNGRVNFKYQIPTFEYQYEKTSYVSATARTTTTKSISQDSSTDKKDSMMKKTEGRWQEVPVREDVISDSTEFSSPTGTEVLENPEEKIKSNSAGHIKVMTFNVCYSTYEWERRLEAFLDLIVRHHTKNTKNNQQEQEQATEKREGIINVICLQEVTPHFLYALLCNDTIRQLYYVSDCIENKFSTLGPLQYGVVMLVDKSLPFLHKFELISLPTRMGRTVLVASFGTQQQAKKDGRTASTGAMAIATVQLESTQQQSYEWKKRQLQIINNQLTSYDVALIVGDFQITPGTTEGLLEIEDDTKHAIRTGILFPGFEDIWKKEYGNECDVEGSTNYHNSLTYDSTKNYNVIMKSKEENNMEATDNVVVARSDRMYVKDTNNEYRTSNIHIIGHEPIHSDKDDKTEKHLYISNHVGLIVDYYFSPES